MNTKIIKLYLLVSLFFSLTLYAQENDLLNNLTEEQKELIASQKKQLLENRDEFKATLTEKQLNILKDVSLSKDERIKTLMASLTENQKKILIDNRRVAEQKKEHFKATITDEQRQKIRSEIGPVRNAQEKKELRERIIENRKQRIRNN